MTPLWNNPGSTKGRLHRQAFTLIEVLVSVAVLSIAVLGVIGALAFGVLASDSAGNFSTATQLGREILENIRIDRYDLDPFDPPDGLVDASLDATPRKALNAAPLDGPMMRVFSDTRFTRNIQITEIDPGRLVRIQVRIYWIQQGKEKFVETSALLRSGK